MTRYRCITFIVILLLSFPFACMALDFQCSLSGGYGFPAARFETGPTYAADDSNTALSWKDGLASYGNGFKINAEIALFFNDNLGIAASSGVSLRGGYEIMQEFPKENAREIHTANYVPITAGIKLQGSNKRIRPFIYLMPGIIIPFNVGGNVIYRDLVGDTIFNEIDITEEYKIGYIICTGIGVLFKLSKSIGINLECSPSYGSSFLKGFTKKYKKDGEVYFTETVRIYRDRKKLPADESGDDFEKINMHGAPYISFSSISVKTGVTIMF